MGMNKRRPTMGSPLPKCFPTEGSLEGPPSNQLLCYCPRQPGCSLFQFLCAELTFSMVRLPIGARGPDVTPTTILANWRIDYMIDVWRHVWMGHNELTEEWQAEPLTPQWQVVGYGLWESSHWDINGLDLAQTVHVYFLMLGGYHKPCGTSLFSH